MADRLSKTPDPLEFPELIQTGEDAAGSAPKVEPDSRLGEGDADDRADAEIRVASKSCSTAGRVLNGIHSVEIIAHAAAGAVAGRDRSPIGIRQLASRCPRHIWTRPVIRANTQVRPLIHGEVGPLAR